MSKKSRRRITHPEHKAHRHSILSYTQIQTAGKGETIKKRILNYLVSWEGEPLSTRQLEIHLGIEKNCLTAPLLELRLSGKLIVVDKNCATTKKLVMHYQHPEKRKESPQATLF